MRASSEAVKRWPLFFARDGATEDELQAQREEVFYQHESEVSAETDRAAREEQAKQRPAIPVERRLRVTDGFRLGVRTFAAGEIVDREDKAIANIVAEHPQYFETPGRPLT
jgi:hypothetical protein